MTPHHLHALAAAWSLQAARHALATHVTREARHNTGSLLDAAPVLRSGVMGVRHGTGGHGDPTGALLLASPRRETTWAERQAKTDQRLDWIARQFAPGTGTPLGRILNRIPALLPGTALLLHRHLDDEDQLVRGWLEIGPDRQPLPGVACPHCGQRQLQVQTAGPVDVWTVVCAAEHRAGQGCSCGQAGSEGVAHIWPRAVVLGAVAGAAPTT